MRLRCIRASESTSFSTRTRSSPTWRLRRCVPCRVTDTRFTSRGASIPLQRFFVDADGQLRPGQGTAIDWRSGNNVTLCSQAKHEVAGDAHRHQQQHKRRNHHHFAGSKDAIRQRSGTKVRMSRVTPPPPPLSTLTVCCTCPAAGSRARLVLPFVWGGRRGRRWRARECGRGGGGSRSCDGRGRAG